MELFIVGVPRSGTTLLQAILASNPGICSTKETHFFKLAFKFFRDCDSEVNLKNLREFIKLLYASYPEVYDIEVITKYNEMYRKIESGDRVYTIKDLLRMMFQILKIRYSTDN